jgi:hypothetical protein
MPKDYGMRHNPEDGPKYSGWKGELKDIDGNAVTEMSIGVNIDDKETDIPLIVPDSTDAELKRLLNKQAPTDAMVKKAYDWAVIRLKNNQSPFKNPEDE